MPDMYAFQASKQDSTSEKTSAETYDPNILPCRIHHDGPVESAGRFWAPKTDEKGTVHTIPHGVELQVIRVIIY